MVPELNSGWPDPQQPGRPHPSAAYPDGPRPGQGTGASPVSIPSPGPQYWPGDPAYPGGQGPELWMGPAPVASPLPVVPREYHEFFRTQRFRWWKPLLSILMFAGTWFVVSAALSAFAIAYDLSTGRATWDGLAAGQVTPMIFASNNVALALGIPLAGLAGWAVFGQRPRWMSSIVGGFRWGLFLRFAAIAAPIFALGMGLSVLLSGGLELTWNDDSGFLIVVILATTPCQAAGEEYGVRGILARSVGSWFGSTRVGLLVATVVTSMVFMLLHGAGDPWLNVYYFSVGVACSLLVWRTGGLEAAVALHVCNNMISEITLPFGGLAEMFDRGAGTAGPETLIQMFFTAAVTGAMIWLGRRLRLPMSTAPGSSGRPPSFAGAE